MSQIMYLELIVTIFASIQKTHIAELIDEFDCDGVYFDDAGVREFVEFANAWNKKYEEYCFRPDTSIVVLVQEVCRKRDHND